MESCIWQLCRSLVPLDRLFARRQQDIGMRTPLCLFCVAAQLARRWKNRASMRFWGCTGSACLRRDMFRDSNHRPFWPKLIVWQGTAFSSENFSCHGVVVLRHDAAESFRRLCHPSLLRFFLHTSDYEEAWHGGSRAPLSLQCSRNQSNGPNPRAIPFSLSCFLLNVDDEAKVRGSGHRSNDAPLRSERATLVELWQTSGLLRWGQVWTKPGQLCPNLAKLGRMCIHGGSRPTLKAQSARMALREVLVPPPDSRPAWWAGRHALRPQGWAVRVLNGELLVGTSRSFSPGRRY